MITNLFGIPVSYHAWNKENALPLYITESYEFQLATIDTQKCIMLILKEEISTIPALKKHIKKIQEVEYLPVVLSLSSVSSYRRKSLIENRIPFVTGKQMYLPFMGTLLVEEKEPEKEVEKFMFSTQQLVLFYIYNGKQRLYMSEATEKLPFTAMTLSRAVKQLEAVELFHITKEGVNKVIEAECGNYELFMKLKRYFSNPIRMMGYVEKEDWTEEMVSAGETALEEKTMLNPNRVATYAIYHKLFDKKKLKKELIDPDKQIRLELWQYDPKQLTKEDMVDSLSLVLSLEECEDERIEEAVEELLEMEFGK